MATFSDRLGITQPAMLQVDAISTELANSLWNVFHTLYHWEYWPEAARVVCRGFTKTRVDHLPTTPNDCSSWLSDVFFGGQWFQTYNLVEFLVLNHQLIMAGAPGHKRHDATLATWLNKVLERENSAYRFVGQSLAPISNHAEVTAVEKAAGAAVASGLQGAEKHIRASVAMLSLKPAPDYRNAVKEAISAVESVAKQLANDERTTLTPALKALASKTTIHPALHAGFSSIYGYTNDADGIRHSMLENATVDFAEAKYMVVSCSAFVHYLIEKGAAAGLLKGR